jgi:hypothetical protein
VVRPTSEGSEGSKETIRVGLCQHAHGGGGNGWRNLPSRKTATQKARYASRLQEAGSGCLWGPSRRTPRDSQPSWQTGMTCACGRPQVRAAVTFAAENNGERLTLILSWGRIVGARVDRGRRGCKRKSTRSPSLRYGNARLHLPGRAMKGRDGSAHVPNVTLCLIMEMAESQLLGSRSNAIMVSRMAKASSWSWRA